MDTITRNECAEIAASSCGAGCTSCQTSCTPYGTNDGTDGAFKEADDVVLAARSVAFGALAALFQAEPTEQVLHAALSPAVRDAFAVATDGGVDAPATAPFDELVGAATSIDDLAGEYTRLFVGPFAPIAPPWESTYREPGRCLYNATTLAVENAYRELPFTCGDVPEGPGDHVAFECSFVSACYQRALDELLQGDAEDALRCHAIANRFLRDHLARWVPEFAQLANTADTPFYGHAASLLDQLVRACV